MGFFLQVSTGDPKYSSLLFHTSQSPPQIFLRYLNTSMQCLTKNTNTFYTCLQGPNLQCNICLSVSYSGGFWFLSWRGFIVITINFCDKPESRQESQGLLPRNTAIQNPTTTSFYVLSNPSLNVIYNISTIKSSKFAQLIHFII